MMQELLIRLAEEISNGVLIVDSGGNIIYSNSVIEEILGFATRELKGRHVGVVGAEQNFVSEEILPVLKEEGKWAGELIARHSDGNRLSLWLRASMIKNHKEQRIAIMIVGEKGKDMREKFMGKEEVQQAVINGISESILLLDREGRVLTINETGAVRNNKSPDEMLGKDVFSFMPSELARVRRSYFEKVLQGKESLRFTDRRLDGSYYDNLVYPILDSQEEVSRVAVFAQDITKRKRAEEKLKRYTGELEESNRMKDLFNEIIRHDLANPINIARWYVELLLEEGENREELDNLKKNLNKAIEIMENARILYWVEREDALKKERLDLKDVIKELSASFEPVAEKAGMEIEVRAAERMPVKANRIIEEVFSNLISNAIKYARVDKKVLVESEEGESYWIIKVIDFGPGIADEYKKSIFERFERKEKEGVRGTGLGLAIARRIVELHHGRI